jgi:hypothetical protein
MLRVIGEEEFICDSEYLEDEDRIEPLVSDEEGRFSSSLLLPYGYGGAYSLAAFANFDGAEKASGSKVFYVEGPYLALPKKIEVTQGYTVNQVVSLSNVGTINLTGFELSSRFPEGAGLAAVFTGNIPQLLGPGSQESFTLELSASPDAEAGKYEAEFTVQTQEDYYTNVPVKVIVEEAVPKYRITVNGENKKVTAALKPGETSASIVRVMNEGTAPIENIQVTPPRKLPWVTISTSGTELVLPIKSRTIRDENASASILVTITPEIYVAPGTYNDEVVISSNAGEAKVPLLIYVGPETVGTIVLQMVDQDYIPIPKAAVTIYGPHSTPGEQPAAPTVHRETADSNGIVTFMNIQAGTYTLTARASYHKDIQMTLEVPALIDLEPLPVQMEKIPFTLSYDYRTLSETQSAIVTGGDYDDAVLRASMPPASAIPSLVANYPGSEFWYSSQLSEASNNFAVRNPSTEGSVYDVEARVTDAEALPEGSIRLRMKNQTGGTAVLSLGEFGPEAAEEIYWDIDLDKFYDPADIQPMGTEWDYRVVFPEGSTPGRIAAWEKILGYDHTVLRLDNSNEETGVYYYHIVPKKTVAQPYIPDNRIPKFYGDNYIFDFNIMFTGNRFTTAGEWETISYKVPVRLHYQPRDAMSIPVPEDDKQETKVMAAFTKQSKTPPVKKQRTYPWYPPTKAQLRAWQMYDQASGDNRYFSRNFLSTVSSVPSEKPEPVGPAVADLSFSQEVVTEQEVFTAKFNLFNPSKYKLLENVDLEVIVTDGTMDENGKLSEGARVYNSRFNIKPLIAINGALIGTIPGEPGNPGEPPDVPEGEYDDSTGNAIYDWTVLPETDLSVLWQLNADPGLAETSMFNDELDSQLLKLAEHMQCELVCTVYIHYKFELDGQLYEGYTKGQRIKIEPQPKLFVSYALEKQEGNMYDLVIKATNAGEGTAHNVTFGMPSIPGMGEGQVIQVLSSYSDFAGERQGAGSLNLGDIPSGETAAGKFTIMGDGLENLTKLPTIPVETKRSVTNPNIITVPLTMQRAYYSDFDELKNEIDKLEENLHKILERSGSDLGGVVIDAYDFARQQAVVASWSAMMDHMKAFFSLTSFVQKYMPRFGNALDFWKRDESFDDDIEIPDMPENPEEKELIPLDPDELDELKNYKGPEDGILFKLTLGLKNKDGVMWDSVKDALSSGIQSLVKSFPEKSVKIQQTVGALQGKTWDDIALICYYLAKRKELKNGIDQLEEEIDKIKKELPSVAGKSVAAVRAVQKEMDSLLDRLDWSIYPDFYWEKEGKEFLAYKEEAEYYLQEAGVAFNSAEMHTGEQREVWINLGRELFRTCKENQILAESALSGVIQNANEQVKPLLQKLRLLYIETALYSNEPLKMAQARFERQMELEEMKTSVATVEGYLVEMGIDPEIIDLGLPNLKARDILNYLLDVPAVLNAFTDVKELAAVCEILPEWAELLGKLAADARMAVSDLYVLGQLLQEFVDKIYALTGGWEIPEEDMNDFIEELEGIDSTMRPKRLLAEAIRYLPFYADVSRDSIVGDDGSFIPESTERMLLEIRREVANAGKFNILEMQDKVTDLLEEARAILEVYDHPADTPSYYPTEVLINYLKSVNAKLENGWKLGNYPNIWLYDGYEDDLVALNYNLGETYRAQNEFYMTLASSSSLLEERYQLETARAAGMLTSMMTSMMGGLTAGVISTSLGYVNSYYDDALGQWESSLVDRQGAINAAVGEQVAYNYLVIGNTLSREVGVAQTVLNVLEAVDRWRKIDPPLPLTVESFSIPDVDIVAGSETSNSTAPKYPPASTIVDLGIMKGILMNAVCPGIIDTTAPSFELTCPLESNTNR